MAEPRDSRDAAKIPDPEFRQTPPGAMSAESSAASEWEKVNTTGDNIRMESRSPDAANRQDVCMCDAVDDETGEYVGWIACPESLCERPDHSHARLNTEPQP